jgi:hypothetical protein
MATLADRLATQCEKTRAHLTDTRYEFADYRLKLALENDYLIMRTLIVLLGASAWLRHTAATMDD